MARSFMVCQFTNYEEMFKNTSVRMSRQPDYTVKQ